MRISTAMIACVVFACLSPRAQAEEPNPGRYTMERTENGFVRLDTATGEVSLCRERDEQIVCQMAADERSAFEDELAGLRDRLSALEAAVSQGSAKTDERLPTDEEIDRTMGVMQTFMRRFFKMIDELNRDFDRDRTPPGGAEPPQRT